MSEIKLVIKVENNPASSHLALMTQDDNDVTQCLWCGHWTRGEPSLLNRVTCVDDGEDYPLELLEVKA